MEISILKVTPEMTARLQVKSEAFRGSNLCFEIRIEKKLIL